uniref:SFRICE_009274 n=1 Tax=Spodoptera frugiperda TaxID=7108 RepID=A0A2H1VCS3_SPOFR
MTKFGIKKKPIERLNSIMIENFASTRQSKHLYNASCNSCAFISISRKSSTVANKDLLLSPPRRTTSRHQHPLAPRHSENIVGPPCGRSANVTSSVPRSALNLITFLDQRPSILRATWPAHCHFSLHILRAMSVSGLIKSEEIILRRQQLDEHNLAVTTLLTVQPTRQPLSSYPLSYYKTHPEHKYNYTDVVVRSVEMVSCSDGLLDGKQSSPPMESAH